jgi:phosphatidylserine/phosphatidylglycerophosphate/cardiolipin synthase-like enzyme
MSPDMPHARPKLGWVLLFLTACTPQILSQPVAAPVDADWGIVYFTDPDAPLAREVEDGPDEDIAAAIYAARQSVDMAIYDLNLWSIRDALLDAHQRGVAVRLVVEADNAGRRELQELAAAGIPIVADTSPDFMHSKFVIIDAYEVWTGSSNFTVSDMYGNRNNIIRLRSAELAENYMTEFDEMFVAGRFGERSLADTPHPEMTIAGRRVLSYFSPDDGVQTQLVALIAGAQESIRFLAFSLTSDAIGDALVAARQRGVSVSGVMDDDQLANAGGEFDYLRQNGIDVRADERDSNLHDKVLIIDGAIVVTGSYNFSSNAEFRNDENMLVIYDVELAEAYLRHFELMWELTQK